MNETQTQEKNLETLNDTRETADIDKFRVIMTVKISAGNSNSNKKTLDSCATQTATAEIEIMTVII